MKIPDWLKCYGDMEYRGKCPRESIEQRAFFNHIRAQYPKTYGAIAIHVHNEGNRHMLQTVCHKREGMVNGSCDIIIPGNPTFCCEMKRHDHTQSKWQPGQLEYLKACHDSGAFTCVALGYEGAWIAFLDWKIKYG